MPNSVKDIRDFFQQNTRSELPNVEGAVALSPVTVTNSQVIDYRTVQTTQAQTRHAPGVSTPLNPVNRDCLETQHKQASTLQSTGQLQLEGVPLNQLDSWPISTSHQTEKMYGISQIVNRRRIQNNFKDKQDALVKYKKDLEAKHQHYLEKRQSQIQEETKRENESRQNNSALQQTNDSTDESHLQVMDLCIVMEMFKDLKKQISEQTVIQGETRISDIENRQHMHETKMIQLEREMSELRTRNQMLTGVVTHMSDKLADSERKLEQLELNSMKKQIVLTGLELKERKGCKQALSTLLGDYLKVQICIDDLFFLNQECTSPLVFAVENMAQKRQIFANLKNIKGLKNQEGKPYVFSDYLPPAMNNRKRQERDLYNHYTKNIAPNTGREVEWKYGKLKINSENFKKLIQVPSPKKILSLAEKDIDKLLLTPTTMGTKVEHDGNIFIGFATAPGSIQEVENAYCKLKLTYPSAKAYSLCFYHGWSKSAQVS